MEPTTPTRMRWTYLRSALNLALGAGAALGGSYVVSRLRERQDKDATLARLEQMLAQLTKIETEKPQ